MKSKILILDNKIYSLSKISNFLKQKKFEVVKPTETQSVFNICSKADVDAVIIDLRLFGEKSAVFIRNLKENVLPEHVKLITISDHTSPRQIFDKITLDT
ncbi:MAG: hypothetical protein L6264_06970 [Weeksellaceae bacterium]|nr:hypothetical protein [Bacteroidota bacterium]MCG2780673.1 hypothetical protein [Weeksellaceae bacterium]